MAHIFISYSRKDTKAIDKLALEIETAGYTYWIDRGSIGGGDQWDEEVANAIAECDAFIVALSPTSVKSKAVKNELNFALEEDRKVIPVILKSVEIPKAVRFRLGALNRIDATSKEGIEKVIEALGGKKISLYKTNSDTIPPKYIKDDVQDAYKTNSDTTPPKATKDDTEELIDKGFVLNGQYRHEEALALFEEVLRIDPEHILAWENKSLSLFWLGRYEEALASFEEFIRFDPDGVKTMLFVKGEIMEKLGRHEESLASYEELIRLYPEDNLPWTKKGQALERLGRHEESLQAFESSIRLYHDDALAWMGKSIVLKHMGRSEEAEEAFEKAYNFGYEYYEEE